MAKKGTTAYYRRKAYDYEQQGKDVIAKKYYKKALDVYPPYHSSSH